MAVNKPMVKEDLLLKMGVSTEDAKRYLDIDDKLRNYCRENSNQGILGLDSGAPWAVDDIVRELVVRGFLPHRAIVDEIKASVAEEMEEERELLRSYVASMKEEMNVQLLAIRHGVDLQLQQLGIPQQQSPQQLSADIKDKNTDLQAPPLSQKSQHHKTSQLESKGGDTLPSQHQDLEKSASLSGGDVLPSESDDAPEQSGQSFDISNDLLWFREQVKQLQEEQKHYRHELRRQEQQNLLQQRLSVSKLEVQEELTKTKEEIINSVKALWAFTEVEFNDFSKLLHKETKDAVCQMLTKNQDFVQRTVGETKEVVSATLSENLKPAIQESMCEMTSKQERNQRQMSENIVHFESMIDNLHSLTVGQSQRVIDTIRNAMQTERRLFSLYLKDFQNLVKSGRTVTSFPCAFDSYYTFAVLRGAVKFTHLTERMAVGITSIVSPRELGLDSSTPSALQIKARIKNQTVDSQPAIEVGATTIICEADPKEENASQFVQIGELVECEALTSSGYDGLSTKSVLVEFEVMLVKEPRNASVLSSFLRPFQRAQ